MAKVFILDTNVLLHDFNSITNFEDNEVVIPIVVIEELDTFKNHPDERGKNARLVSRKLDEFRELGKLNEGVKTEGGGIIRIDLEHPRLLPEEFKFTISDNQILNTAYYYQKKGRTTIVVTKDTNLRLKAEAVGIKAQDFEKDKVDLNELYTGIANVDVSSQEVDKFYKEGVMYLPKGAYYPNQFAVLKSKDDEKKSALGKIEVGDKPLVKALNAEKSPWGIKPLNKEQRFAIELLLDESVDLVTLVGNAGTGKTLISLAAGLQKAVEENVYRKLLICRSIVPVGKDIGFLPGTKEDKLEVWMGAIYDNLEFIIDRKHPNEAMEKFNYLIESGKVEIASVTHIRGRTLPKQYMIVDDAQNLSPHEVKTILSRAGEGTKVVVTGDPYQIDTPYLDASSNGLTYIVERFKGQKAYGHVTFTRTERSRLAGLVTELL
jgi:PhoH-like ATPase